VLWTPASCVPTKSGKAGRGNGADFKDYFQFNEQSDTFRRIASAINRGEKETRYSSNLSGRLQRSTLAEERLPLPMPEAPTPAPAPMVEAPLAELVPESAPVISDGAAPLRSNRIVITNAVPPRTAPPRRGAASSPHAEFFKAVTADALVGCWCRAWEREIRRELTHVLKITQSMCLPHLRSKLLAAPWPRQPSWRSTQASALAASWRHFDETGNMLEDGVIYPHGRPTSRNDAKRSCSR